MWNSLTLLVVDQLGGAFRRNVAAAACYGAACVIALTGIVFGLLAAYFWLRTGLSDIQASLLMAGSLLLIAAMVVWLGKILRNRRRTNNEIASTALLAIPIAARLATSRSMNWGTVTLVAIVAAAMLVGRQRGSGS